jgi:hypothetical protein
MRWRRCSAGLLDWGGRFRRCRRRSVCRCRRWRRCSTGLLGWGGRMRCRQRSVWCQCRRWRRCSAGLLDWGGCRNRCQRRSVCQCRIKFRGQMSGYFQWVLICVITLFPIVRRHAPTLMSTSKSTPAQRSSSTSSMIDTLCPGASLSYPNSAT